MKIFQIMPEFALAGAERMCEALSLELHKRGHEVQAISLYDYHSSITEHLEQSGIRIRYLGKQRGPDLSIIPRLVRIFRQEKPDILHTHRYVCEYVIPAAVMAGCAGRIHTVHNMAEREASPKKLQRFFFRHCRTLPVSISPQVQASIQAYYRLAEVPMVANGIDLTKCAPKTAYDQRGETFRFLHVGRFMEQKNHRSLVAAFARLHDRYPHTSLTLVGEGPLRDTVSGQVRSRGLSDAVFMPGGADDIFPYYADADVFVLPSAYEGLPLTLLEAMGCGLPIIASRVGGIPDILADHQSALLCLPNEDSILQAMETFYLDHRLRESLGRCAREKAFRYSVAQMTDGYEKIYRSCTGQHTDQRNRG